MWRSITLDSPPAFQYDLMQDGEVITPNLPSDVALRYGKFMSEFTQYSCGCWSHATGLTRCATHQGYTDVFYEVTNEQFTLKQGRVTLWFAPWEVTIPKLPRTDDTLRYYVPARFANHDPLIPLLKQRKNLVVYSNVLNPKYGKYISNTLVHKREPLSKVSLDFAQPFFTYLKGHNTPNAVDLGGIYLNRTLALHRGNVLVLVDNLKVLQRCLCLLEKRERKL